MQNRQLEVLREAALVDVKEAAEKLRGLGWDVKIEVVHDHDAAADKIELSVTVQYPPPGPKRLPLDPEKVAVAAGANLDEPLNGGKFAENPRWPEQQS